MDNTQDSHLVHYMIVVANRAVVQEKRRRERVGEKKERRER